MTKASQSSSRPEQSSGQTQGAPAASTSTVSPSDSSDSSGQNGSSGGTVTAARLAQDQADIDTADARLDEASASRRLAMLRAPYAGKLLQVNLARGDQASTSDTAAVLVGKGVTTVTTSVSNAQVRGVRRGQSVTVTPAGWATSLTGTVERDRAAARQLRQLRGDGHGGVRAHGGRGQHRLGLDRDRGRAKDAVTVPTSAISRTGTRAVVRVLDGDTVTRTVVTVGVVGKRKVSISQGLKAGATVVLADLDAAVPSSTTNNDQQRFRQRRHRWGSDGHVLPRG